MKINVSDLNNEQSVKTTERTYRRNGNTYTIKNGESTEDVDDIYKIIDDLYTEARHMYLWADMKANLYNILHIISSIFIIISGSVVGVLGITTQNISNTTITSTTTYTPSMLVIIVLGFTVTTLKAILAIFAIEKRKILLKESGLKLRKISRDIIGLKHVELTNPELMKRIDDFYTEIDELDITMFTNGNFGVNTNKKDVKPDVTDVAVTV